MKPVDARTIEPRIPTLPVVNTHTVPTIHTRYHSFVSFSRALAVYYHLVRLIYHMCDNISPPPGCRPPPLVCVAPHPECDRGGTGHSLPAPRPCPEIPPMARGRVRKKKEA